ncbi:MAG: ABC transporter permease subunit, partial [Actinomycetota bacterium]
TDSLQVWQESRVEPDQVLLLVALALLGAVAGALVVRAYAHGRRLRWLSVAAFPVMLAAAACSIFLAGVGAEAVDLMYRVDVATAIGSGSPILVLLGVVLLSFGQVLFMMRVGIGDELQEDYVLTAQAKGLTQREVRDTHVGRNALIPTLAASFLALPTLLAGMIIVEFELEVRGLSWAFFQAVENQDVPMMMGVLVVLGLLGVGLRLVTDLAIAHIDPRQREARV